MECAHVSVLVGISIVKMVNMIYNINLDYKKIGLIYFTYTAIVAGLIQLVILPYLLPHLHAGNGFLLQLDCSTFHDAAVKTATAIKTHGWSAWQIRPEDFGSSGIAAVLYALFVPKLWVLIPLNAFVHALSGVIIIAITNRIVNNFGMAVLCSLPFILFPSSATWYAQIHQDGFSILGWLMLFYAWVLVFDQRPDGKQISCIRLVKIFVCVSVGYYLMWAMRPYHTRFYSILSILFFISGSAYFISRSILARRILWRNVTVFIFILSISLGMKFIFSGYRVWWEVLPSQETENSLSTQEISPQEGIMNSTGKSPEKITAKDKIQGVESPRGKALDEFLMTAAGLKSIPQVMYTNLPEKIQGSGKNKYSLVPRLVGELNDNRQAYASHAMYSGAASNIDLEISVDSFGKLVAYIPRAYQIAFLAPFPTTWLQSGSSESNTMMRRISIVEMILVYIGLLGLPFLVYFYYRKIIVWILILSNMIILLPIVIGIPNVGTIYRMRYGFLMVIVALGYAGLFSFYESRFNKKSSIAGASH